MCQERFGRPVHSRRKNQGSLCEHSRTTLQAECTEGTEAKVRKRVVCPRNCGQPEEGTTRGSDAASMGGVGEPVKAARSGHPSPLRPL